MTTIILTVWLCTAAHPLCLPSEDPTGPATVREVQDTNLPECELFFAIHTMTNPPPKDMVGRHTCQVKGEGL